MLQVTDADLIAMVRQIRKLIIAMDSIGFPARLLYADDELSQLIPTGLPSKIVDVAFEIHDMLQEIENSRRYKDAIKQCCFKEEGEEIYGG